MKTKYTLIFGALLMLASSIEAQTVSKVGTSAAQFLRIPVGARSSALGGAVTAGVNDPSALYWNPSQIANIRETTIMVEHADWFADLGHSFIGFVVPTSEKGSFGLSLTALTMGEFEETTVDMQEGTGRTFNAYSVSVGASYAYYLFDNFIMGATLKYVGETIWNTTAGTVAFDVGTSFVTPFKGLKFAASVSNWGGRMKLFGDDLLVNTRQSDNAGGEYAPDAYLYTGKFDLPLQMKFGVAYDVVKSNALRASVFLDGTNPSDNNQSVSLATEIGLLDELIQLRAGMPDLFLDDRTMNFTAGLGLRADVSESFKFDVGYSYLNHIYLGGVNRISLQLKF